jgi:transposase-like protein
MAADTANKGNEGGAAEEQAPAVAHVNELLTETRSKMEGELEELRASHEAFLRLEQILSNFDAITSDKPVRTRKASNGSRAPRGSRSAEFVALVTEAGDEGITVTEAADKMDGINPNYLYRIAKELTEEDAIRKDGKKYFAVAAPAAPAAE